MAAKRREDFGIVKALIDTETRSINLQVNRYGPLSQQLGDNAVKSMIAWAARRLADRYPDYVINGTSD